MKSLKLGLFATLITVLAYNVAVADDFVADVEGVAKTVVLLPPVDFDPPPMP